MKKVLSVPCLMTSEKLYTEMKRNKSETNLHSITLTRKQLKTIVFIKRKIDSESRVIANGVQDIQFAQDVIDSHSFWKTFALTVLMIASIEKDEEKVQRIRLIIGTITVLELMKHT